MHQHTDQQAASLSLPNYNKQEPGTITQIRAQIFKSRKVYFFQFSPSVLPPCRLVRPPCTGLSFRALSASWSQELDKLDLLGINDNRPTLTSRSLRASILNMEKSFNLFLINLWD